MAWQTGKILCRQPIVPMVKSSNQRRLGDLPKFGQLHLSVLRRVFLQGEVRSACVVVHEVPPKELAQVIFAEHNHMIDAIAT